ncbi:hypothetical protein [Agrococcus sp. ProA11]|uniref:hypothetical protein n=1 Tax=Agrococcus chionoecetis TaxID=3153752 RepID=UPI0032617542
MPESWWGNAIFSLVPTIVLGLIFWMVMRMIIRGDRTARMEYDRIEAEERIKMGLPPRGAAPAAVAEAASASPALGASAPTPDRSAPGDLPK